MALRGPLAKLYDEQPSPERSAPTAVQPIPAYKNLTVNLPLEILEELREYAFHHRMRKNEVVLKALQSYMRGTRE